MDAKTGDGKKMKDEYAEAWMELCLTMRSVSCREFADKTAYANFPNNTETNNTHSGAAAGLTVMCFRLSLPGVQRPLAVYSPVLARVWRRLLGDAWYASVHPPTDIALPRGQFIQWQKDPAICAAVRANIVWWAERAQHVPMSPADWHKMLQAAYDFAEPDLFDRLLRAATLQHPDPKIAPLFLLVW